MKHCVTQSRSAIILLLAAFCISSPDLTAQDENKLTADSMPREGVPTGEIKGPFKWQSKIFPGTIRDYWIYVPAQYKKGEPACVMIVQDGLNRAKGWKLTTVMDNLIHKGDIPVMIGIFVSPGVVPAPNENSQPRFNRSFEYDGMSNKYARFLVEEILPEVSEEYSLSDDPSDRAVAGASSGGIAAFGAAWHRPDQFRRVLSTIGTFVSLRGGNEYPSLIRKFEPKPIRVFLQDGSNDNNLFGGEWWIANQDMLSAFKFSGYDVKHAWGTGGHNSKHAAAIMPDAMRWLWKDQATKVVRPGIAPNRRTDLVIPNENWEWVPLKWKDGDYWTSSTVRGLATDSVGRIVFADDSNNTIRRVDADDKLTVLWKAESKDAWFFKDGIAVGPNDEVYAVTRGNQILKIENGKVTQTHTFEEDVRDMVVLNNGRAYVIAGERLWSISPKGKLTRTDYQFELPWSVHTTSDQSQLVVTSGIRRFAYSLTIQRDGSPTHMQEYAHLHRPDHDSPGASAMTTDSQGRMYFCSDMGVQITDQLGRVHLILDVPNYDDRMFGGITFGGKEMDNLYVSHGYRLYRRKLKATGVSPARKPVKPPRPRL